MQRVDQFFQNRCQYFGTNLKSNFTFYLCQFVTPLHHSLFFVCMSDPPPPRLHPSCYLKEKPEIQFKCKQKFGCHQFVIFFRVSIVSAPSPVFVLRLSLIDMTPGFRANEMYFKVERPWNTEKYCRPPWLDGKKNF